MYCFNRQAFVPGCNKVLSLSSGKLLLWNAPTPNCGHCLDVIEFRRSRTSDFVCMKLSNNGRILAASTVDNIVTVWDVATIQVILALPGHSSLVLKNPFT
jgi:WD40 repeat protein